MAVTEQIARQVRRLPEPLQTEVLHFVEYLLTRTDDGERHREDQAWSDLSLKSAMRGLEDEGDPDYSEADLSERFS